MREYYARVHGTAVNSEFTEQDGRKKRTAKRLSVTTVTGPITYVLCDDLHLS